MKKVLFFLCICMTKYSICMEEYVRQHQNNPDLVAAWNEENTQRRQAQIQQAAQIRKKAEDFRKKCDALMAKGDAEIAAEADKAEKAYGTGFSDISFSLGMAGLFGGFFYGSLKNQRIAYEKFSFETIVSAAPIVISAAGALFCGFTGLNGLYRRYKYYKK